MTENENWTRVECDAGGGQADQDLLRRLIDGDVAVVRLRGLLPAAEFAANRERLRRIFSDATTTRYVNGALTTIGPYLAKYLSRPDDYFTAARAAENRLDEVSFDLSAQVRQALTKEFGLHSLRPAEEPDGRRYGDAVVRVHADGVSNPLHNDNIMRDARDTGLALAGLRHQLSCVVCVEECDEGGELRIYQRSWRPEDEAFKIDGGLGYDAGVVAGAPVHTFRPRAEDVYLINPTHYHEIERVHGADRTTLGFFVGFPGESLTDAVVWG
ncbi:hypothetical protein ACTOB_006553 [Actinoplanes oblitus]|uniref:Fe2OG dioxygenase domain-containing protein n=1 Tax=Actinoplanes oblitus TaxID=3040509 RepID=A0ABY8W9I9_9ACTN|nr:hypothetical protein [Actinoplanes oblitus]WIM94526.1 hypothetical protein ACTOB_006553 [Actinoplanes oblitus]